MTKSILGPEKKVSIWLFLSVINTAQAMKTVDVANCCLKDVTKHAEDSHWYIKYLNSSTQLTFSA